MLLPKQSVYAVAKRNKIPSVPNKTLLQMKVASQVKRKKEAPMTDKHRQTNTIVHKQTCRLTVTSHRDTRGIYPNEPHVKDEYGV